MSRTSTTYRVDLRVCIDVTVPTVGGFVATGREAANLAMDAAETINKYTRSGVHLHSIDAMDVTEIAPNQHNWD